MGLTTKTVKVKWNANNKKHYESKGYIFTKWKDEFEIKVEDLSNGCNTVKIDAICDGCGEVLTNITWQGYKKSVHKDGKYYCRKCAVKLFGNEKTKKTQLKNSKSFKQWCYNNLDIDYANEILARWDTKKNGCTPDEVSYRSHGINKKGYWLKCLLHLEHNSELKNINEFVHSIKKYGTSKILNCNKCNSFAMWGINNLGQDFLEKYWDYEENDKLGINPWEIGYRTNIKVYIYCQDKSYHKSYDVLCSNFTKENGSRCPYCRGLKVHKYDSLGYLYPEVLKVWSTKNKLSPYDYSPNSGKEVWWMCLDETHEDYPRRINNSNIANFRCPECQYSKGEKRIEEYLIKHSFVKIIDTEYNNLIELNNIQYYLPQKEFQSLIGLKGGNLSYDFYLPKYNLLIEYQGEMHERFVKGIHKSIKDFEKQVEHDRRKKQYCIDNKIKLLEIWYWDFDNIETILDEELKINTMLKQAN